MPLNIKPAPATDDRETAPVPSAPQRLFRPLSPSQIGLAEHLTRHHVVTLPSAFTN